MTPSRLDSFRAMVARNPANALARFGLANEAVKEGHLDEARDNYQAYLAAHEDEGNGWMRYAEVLRSLGDDAAARDALDRGRASALRHGHPGMAAEIESMLEELDS